MVRVLPVFTTRGAGAPPTIGPMAASYGWLFPETPGDYSTADFLWVDPLTVMDRLGLDSGNADDVALATELVAEASLVLDTNLGHLYGPARCVAATYRVRALPRINFAPPLGSVQAVVLHDESCLPPDDVFAPDLGPVTMSMAAWQNYIDTLFQQGIRLPSLQQMSASGYVADTGYTYCVESPTTMTLCGLGAIPTAGGHDYGLGYGYGSAGYGYGGCVGCNTGRDLITVLYKSRANWPPGIGRIFMALLTDLYQSLGGECSIPPGTTSVTRQGVTWSMDEQNGGTTGVATVDRWLERYQSRLRLRDPGHGTLIYSRYYPCDVVSPYVTAPPPNDLSLDFDSNRETVTVNVLDPSGAGAP